MMSTRLARIASVDNDGDDEEADPEARQNQPNCSPVAYHGR
jgi:hypothetical protein